MSRLTALRSQFTRTCAIVRLLSNRRARVHQRSTQSGNPGMPTDQITDRGTPDPQAEIRRVSPLLPKNRSKNRPAQKPGNFCNARGRRAARAPNPVFQAPGGRRPLNRRPLALFGLLRAPTRQRDMRLLDGALPLGPLGRAPCHSMLGKEAGQSTRLADPVHLGKLESWDCLDKRYPHWLAGLQAPLRGGVKYGVPPEPESRLVYRLREEFVAMVTGHGKLRAQIAER